MSNQKDNKHTKKLRELLDKNKDPDNDSLDDFEKEALEGFASVEDESEIFRLKSELDKRAYSEVFSEKKRSHTAYWYAAAGLLLLIGFSVYFIKTNAVSQEKDLALQKEVPTSIMELNKDQSAVGEKADKQAEVQEDRKNIPEKEQHLPPSAKIFSSDQVKPSEMPAVDKGAAAPAMPASKEYKFVPAPAEPARLEEEVSTATQDAGFANVDSEKDNIVVEQKAKEEVISGTETFNQPAKEKKMSKSSSQRDAAERSSVPAGGVVASAPAVEPVAMTPNYEGGTEALNKELKAKLEPKQLLLKFDAVLFISEKKRVEKVVFTNSFGLSKEQQKNIDGILKTLDKFNVPNSSGPGQAQYTLVFRP